MSIFTCCTCPELPDYDSSTDDPLEKYLGICGCPAVGVICKSSEKIASMCGVEDPDEAVPPSGAVNVYQSVATVAGGRYLGSGNSSTTYTRDSSGNCVSTDSPRGSFCEGPFYDGKYTDKTVVITTSGSLNTSSGDCSTAPLDGTSSTIESTIHTTTTTSPTIALGAGGCDTSGQTTVTYGGSDSSIVSYSDCPDGSGVEYSQTDTCNATVATDGTVSGSDSTEICFGTFCYQFGPYTNSGCDMSGVTTTTESSTSYSNEVPDITASTTYSVLDSEGNALSAATAVEGTSCSSIYEKRTTALNFTKRTCTYTATATNLIVGTKYQGCVRIRRRESYAGTPPTGADTEWHDVEPDTITSFTATDREEELASDVDVPNSQGYEYEVMSAHVWPSSVGCECPAEDPAGD